MVVTLCSFDSIFPVVDKTGPRVTRHTLLVKPVNSPVKNEKPEFKTVVFFVKGEYFVPVNAKKNIKKMFESAKKLGKIYSAKIISWGDQLRPQNKKKALSSNHLKLVEDRNDSLEAYLERLDLHMRVMKISMAEKPEVMDDILSREDKKLKEQFEHTNDANISKSIVMFIFKEKSKPHE
jgi:hypothetical protein